MNVKTYQAETMSKALRLVKAELGADAVILHTRTVRTRGVLGIGGRAMVEITASNDVNVRPQRTALRRRLEPASAAAAPRDNAVRRTYGQTRSPSGATGSLPASVRTDTSGTGGQAASGTPRATDPRLNEEIRQIRNMVHRMMSRQAAQPQPDVPDTLFNQYLALLEQEVTEELADEVIKNVRGALSSDDLESEQTVREAVGKEIARLIPVDPTSQSKSRPTDGRPLTIALIGPTGVGKTTTLAKLAATFKLRERKKVAMVTIDTYRIAAVDQLRTYADIINVPLHVVLTPDELADALARCRGYDVVLIDTAGRSQRDDQKLQHLREFLDLANPHEVHLVLSSTCCQSVLMEAVDRFSQVRIDRIIFTKLDEAVSFGVLLNVVRRVNKQLSYVTTGQEVPHQIEPGRSDRLAGLILGEAV